MNKKTGIALAGAVALLAPMFALAITPLAEPSGGLNITTAISNIFTFIWPIFLAIAILMFIWAGFLFIVANGDATKIANARRAVVWGVIGVAIALLSSSIPFIVSFLITNSNA